MATETINRVSMEVCAPFGVYLNGEQVAVYDEAQESCKHHNRLRREVMTSRHRHRHRHRQRERDRRRTVLPGPIASPRVCVMYLKNGKEHRSAWLYREEYARQGLAMTQAKYGQKNAINLH